MIFVTAGTTINDFKRLFIAVDQLVAEGILADVEAQIGNSSYTPTLCKATPFLSRPEMSARIREAEFVICHAGAGTLDECLGQGKKVIVAPRLAAYGEAADDHQLHAAAYVASKNRALIAIEMAELREKVRQIRHWEPGPINYKPSLIVETINNYIDASPER